jgi:hypothetical protein
MIARKSTEVDFRKMQKRQKTAISALRKSTEVYGSRYLKPAENRTEVYGTVTEVRPPLKRATSAAALIEGLALQAHQTEAVK